MEQQFLAKWYSNILDLKGKGNSVDRFGITLFNSKIKLTPHQIDAAIFAFKSPINKGVILADEVGLGKTIEAGIIIAQLRFERKARILIITPASLMRQWNNELYDKFMLESEIIDRKQYNGYLKQGCLNPFNSAKDIIICSYQFASVMYNEIQKSNFDTVIIDEAHKLRNVYNERSIISNNIKIATTNFKKILLTATPIQNNLMDLYGLTSFIDDNIFGDKEIFRYNYIRNYDDNKKELTNRIKNYMHRTLRKQVLPYIKFTNRIAKTFTFEQTEQEKYIYNELREILLNLDDNPYIIPSKQKHLLMLILSKLMGSSIYALKGTLESILKRLIKIKEENIFEDIAIDDEITLNYEEDIIENTEYEEKVIIDKVELEREIIIIKNLLDKCSSIEKESKYYSLLEALNYSFQHLKNIGANEKVIIFTESRRTQKFLYDSLIADGYEDVLIYNGTNNDELSNKIYQEWINKPENISKINNSKNINMRHAIVDKFKNEGRIFISTEAGAEGLNLQFCSLLINYDLPWNPQRVEQRIGRCHRFGQKFDVAVINFINTDNKVEERIYDLLSTKFHLFNEIFGSSDEILGTIDDGKDIESAIANIYSTCRNETEINRAFELLQQKYSGSINEVIKKTKKELIDNFEEDIQNYFESTMIKAEESINLIEKIFWKLLKIVFNENEYFNDDEYILTINNLTGYQGTYKLSSRNEEDKYIDLNINTNLGKYVINLANKEDLKSGFIKFDLSNYPYNINQLKSLLGKKGYIGLYKYKIKSFEEEEYLFFTGLTETGEFIDDELCQKLFRLNHYEYIQNIEENDYVSKIKENANVYSERIKNISYEQSNMYIKEEINKINKWADDKIQAIELSVELLREQRKELQKQSDLSTNLSEKERFENEIVNITKKIKTSWIELGNFEEKIEIKRKQMIEKIKKENTKVTELKNLFIIGFEVI